MLSQKNLKSVQILSQNLSIFSNQFQIIHWNINDFNPHKIGSNTIAHKKYQTLQSIFNDICPDICCIQEI